MMLRRVFLGAATAIVAAGPIAAEPITLKLNSPAPPMSYVHREVLTPWAEAVTSEFRRHAENPDLLRRHARQLCQHL